MTVGGNVKFGGMGLNHERERRAFFGFLPLNSCSSSGGGGGSRSM